MASSLSPTQAFFSGAAACVTIEVVVLFAVGFFTQAFKGRYRR